MSKNKNADVKQIQENASVSSTEAIVSCAKCGGTNIRKRWHKQDNSLYQENKPCCDKYDNTQVENEHIHLYCDDCLYDWATTTKEQEWFKMAEDAYKCVVQILESHR